MNPATRGADVLNCYRDRHGALDDPEATSAADLIADLRAWTTDNGLDWDAILHQADSHARDELHCSGCGATTAPTDGDEAPLCRECAS